MAFILTGGDLGVLVRLECPYCGEVQARARKPEGERYECRRCYREFTVEAVSPERRPASSSERK